MTERKFCEKERNSKSRIKKKVLLVILGNEQNISQDKKESLQRKYTEFHIRILRVIGDDNDTKQKITQYLRRQSISIAKGDIILHFTDIVW